MRGVGETFVAKQVQRFFGPSAQGQIRVRKKGLSTALFATTMPVGPPCTKNQLVWALGSEDLKLTFPR